MRTPVVAANWKMNGSHDEVSTFLSALTTLGDDKTEVVFCPPAIYLPQAVALIKISSLAVGAQNVSDKQSGAYTGDISVNMLSDVGATHAILGHSERRSYHGEDNQLIYNKFLACNDAGLTPILCIGETADQRDKNQTDHVLYSQLESILENYSKKALKSFIIAYEPVWAIGTGQSATPDDVQLVHQKIRGWLSKVSSELGQQVRILYGGSVTPDNARAIFSMEDVDGGLIGGASLKSQSFLEIISCTK